MGGSPWTDTLTSPPRLDDMQMCWCTDCFWLQLLPVTGGQERAKVLELNCLTTRSWLSFQAISTVETEQHSARRGILRHSSKPCTSGTGLSRTLVVLWMP